MNTPEQIIYPVFRLLANPRVFWAIAASFDGPDAETIQDAFYDLVEHQSHMAETMEEVCWGFDEVCLTMDEAREGVFQIIDDNGQAVELHP